MIFVDSGVWIALAVPTDADHAAAAGWLRTNREPLVTTDYVVDEVLTWLRAHGQAQRALEVAREFTRGAVRLHHVSEDEFQAAMDVFVRFHDKEWSFTDCTSRVVMERLGITTACSFDHHFRQFGTATVVP
jgi:predicted nucleic acid-binding protein